ncbi:hypothetical protein [Azospirillum canadense]|uniref:hypothetical protein n=1 Tax=Azospirillum canadense TaxID=403962 RepID=UPI002226E7F5|nr:hypothetical protein [Azospirillum canadense]MCW2242656.1 hypothetical protein [Azospirillum canadense]
MMGRTGGVAIRLLTFTGLCAVAACANPAADNAMFAQDALIGLPKQTLLSCAGVPNRQAAAGDREFFTYNSSKLVSYPAWGGYGGYWGAPYGYGWGGWPGYYAADVYSVDCEATFTLRNGVVERIVYGGASYGSSRLGQCYAIVQNCLAQIPRATVPPGNRPPQ